MKTDLVDLSETRKSLSVEIPADTVAAAIARLTTQYGKQARLPGFRPGKVPASVVRQRFRGQILHDVAHDLIPGAIDSALTEKGVEPVNTPDVKDVVVEEGKALTFSATFDVLPPFDPGAFGEIQLRRQSTAVDDEQVGQMLERLRDRAARFEPAEGTVAAGHTLVIELERRPVGADGAEGAPEQHQQVSIEMGGPTNPPGFDEAVTGMAIGDTRTFTLPYPADYAVAELAGTTVGYTVTLKELRQRVVPTLDDEFAKDLGDFESLEALRTRVRNDLETEARESSERQLRADLLAKLAERLPFAVPESLVDREVDRRLEEFAHRLMEQRIDPRRANIDWNAFRTAQREPASGAVASALVLDEVARREQLSISDDELAAEFEKVGTRMGLTPDAVRARVEQEGGVGRLQAGLRREKTIDSILARVQVLDA